MSNRNEVKAKELIRQTFDSLAGQDGPLQIEPYSNVRDDELIEHELYMAACNFLHANDIVDRFTVEDRFTHSFYLVTSCVSNEVLKDKLEVTLQQIDTDKYENEEFDAVLNLLDEKTEDETEDEGDEESERQAERNRYLETASGGRIEPDNSFEAQEYRSERERFIRQASGGKQE